MRVSDLTDEHVGRFFLVPTSDGREKRRILYEGQTRRPNGGAFSGGGGSYWVLILCTPFPGVMWFRSVTGKAFAAVICRSTAEIVPLEVDYAVTEDGEIVETAVRTV